MAMKCVPFLIATCVWFTRYILDIKNAFQNNCQFCFCNVYSRFEKGVHQHLLFSENKKLLNVKQNFLRAMFIIFYRLNVCVFTDYYIMLYFDFYEPIDRY